MKCLNNYTRHLDPQMMHIPVKYPPALSIELTINNNKESPKSLINNIINLRRTRSHIIRSCKQFKGSVRIYRCPPNDVQRVDRTLSESVKQLVGHFLELAGWNCTFDQGALGISSDIDFVLQENI